MSLTIELRYVHQMWRNVVMTAEFIMENLGQRVQCSMSSHEAVLVCLQRPPDVDATKSVHTHTYGWYTT